MPRLRFALLSALAVAVAGCFFSSGAQAGTDYTTRTTTTETVQTIPSNGPLPLSYSEAPWFSRYEKAVEAAVTAQKKGDPRQYILIVFTGTDWDAPSNKFARTVLANPQFLRYATLNFLLYRANFPVVPLPPHVSTVNAQLAGHYRIDSYPGAVIVDNTGKLLATVDCEAPHFDIFMANLEDAWVQAVKVGKPKMKSPWAWKKEF